MNVLFVCVLTLSFFEMSTDNLNLAPLTSTTEMLAIGYTALVTVIYVSVNYNYILPICTETTVNKQFNILNKSTKLLLNTTKLLTIVNIF